MTSKREVLRQQRRWAYSAGLDVDSRGYLASHDANLRQPLSASTLEAFKDGGGQELLPRGSAPAKMRALHSSAVLAVNVFDHWVGRDAGPLLESLGIEGTLAPPIAFEKQFSTRLPGNPPNLDVALELEDERGARRVVGIESKFTEWLAPKRAGRPAFKEKYFEAGAALWRERDLAACQALAADLRRGKEHFRHLDAAQLLKHALGLATQRHGAFILGYVYFDAAGAAGSAHRKEVERFADRVGTELGFRAWPYQDLYRSLSARSDVDAKYLTYLGKRYFAGL